MVPPCVVLVINDNPYGLMFALRYPYRSCPWENIGVHVLDSRIFHDGHCYIQGFICRMIMYRVEHIAIMSIISWSFMIIFKTSSFEERRKYTRLVSFVINTQSYKMYQVGLCISWYGKQLSIQLCELTHDICVQHFYQWLGIFPWACINRKIPFCPWSMSPSGVRHQA